MNIPAGWSVILIVTALWNLLIWPQFFKRIVRDDRSRDAAGRPTTFLKVHTVLIGISLVLGIAVGVLGVVAIV